MDNPIDDIEDNAVYDYNGKSYTGAQIKEMYNNQENEETDVSLTKDLFGNRNRREEAIPIEKPVDTNSPHWLHKELMKQPFPKGLFSSKIGGRIIDVRDLADYVTYKTSPKVINTLVTNAMSISKQEILGVKRRKVFKIGPIVWMIVGMVALVAIGGIFLMFGPEITGFFQNMFGGFM